MLDVFPLTLIDPTGHCPGTPGDGVNDDCWNYLMGTGSDSFCYGSGVDICGSGGWQQWFILPGSSCYSAHSCSYQFDVPWTKSELEELSKMLAWIIKAMNSIGIDWQDTNLPGTKYTKDSPLFGHPWANPITKTVHLVNVTPLEILHETGHILDFGSWEQLSHIYARESGACSSQGMGGYMCSTTAVDGYYFRDYGWNSGASEGWLYGELFADNDTFADAFAAWVYHVNDPNGGDPPWKSGRATQSQYEPQWLSIYDAVIVAMTEVYK